MYWRLCRLCASCVSNEVALAPERLVIDLSDAGDYTYEFKKTSKPVALEQFRR